MQHDKVELFPPAISRGPSSTSLKPVLQPQASSLSLASSSTGMSLASPRPVSGSSQSPKPVKVRRVTHVPEPPRLPKIVGVTYRAVNTTCIIIRRTAIRPTSSPPVPS